MTRKKMKMSGLIMRMSGIRSSILILGLFLVLPVVAADGKELPVFIADVPDSLLLYVDEEDIVDTSKVTRHNTVKEENRPFISGMDYIMEKRYRASSDSLSRRWSDHIFIECGAGLEQLVAKGNNYDIMPLTNIRLGVGRQFSALSTLRLTLGAAYGYEKVKDLRFMRMAGKLDYFYSLSSYFSGYKPERILNVSAMAGLGGMYSKLEHGSTSFVPEAHVGAQLRFFTGPQAYVNIEPYIGMATDKSDLVINNTGKKYDTFYGANISFVYYLNDNLSPQARRRILGNGKYRDQLLVMPDTVLLRSWRAPWFVEVANGVNFLSTPELGLTETMGHEMSLSVGRWLSSAIGLRLTAFSRTSTWRKEVTAEQEAPYSPGYTASYNTIYTGARVEGMINPLGLGNRYNWDSRFGFYLLAGGELGRFSKYQSGTHLSCRSEAYTVGARLWARVARDLHLFVEPRFSHNVYHIPYTNVDWNELYNDNSYTVNAGLSIQLRSRRFRSSDGDDDSVGDGSRWVAGIAGGTNICQTRTPRIDTSGSPFGYNGLAYLEYRYGRSSGVRLSFDYVSMARTSVTDFTDNALSDNGAVIASTGRTGLWNHRYNTGIVSLSYDADLTALFSGRYNITRGLTLNMFAGPSLAVIMGETGALDASERLRENHECVLGDSEASGMELGANIGFKLAYHFNRHLSVVLVPTLYLVGSKGFCTLEPPTSKHILPIETVNIGVQYRL